MKPGLQIDIPGGPPLDLRHLVLDVNGTLSADGGLLDGVAERVAALHPLIDIHLVSGDTHGTAGAIAAELECGFTRLEAERQAEAKRGYVERLGLGAVAAVGNGRNDALMLQAAAVGICVIGAEGAAGATVAAADVVCGSVADALDLLLRPKRLIATLRR